jgi:lysophospholipase L1-like esterase
MTVRGLVALAATVLAALAFTACSTAAPREANAPVALFIGDSYTEGTGLTGEDLRARWTTVVSGQLGWKEVNAGCAGSGYVRRGLLCNNTFAERIPTVAFTEPDIVVMTGGINDIGSTPAEGAAAAVATLEALVAAFPDAHVIVIGGIAYADSTPETVTAINQALSASAGELGVTYIDIGEPLLDDPTLLGIDGLHPTVDGHAEVARRVLEALGR